MDVHVPGPLTSGLRQKGVDVLTAQEDQQTTLRDSLLLDRATSLSRVIFTFDTDFLQEASFRQSRGQEFAGIIILCGEKIDFGKCLRDLELIAKVYQPEDIRNRVEFLPL